MIDSKNKRRTIFILFLIIIILFIIYLFKNNGNNDIEKFDIEDENVEVINNFLDNLKADFDKNNIMYRSEKSDNKHVTSILLEIEEQESNQKKMYLTYNFNKKDKEFMNNEQIAKMFGYSLEDINNKVKERFKTYYDEESSEGYVEYHECDFNCYLSFYRNVDFIEQSYSLYVKNNKLIVYLSFSVDSFLSDKDYFENLGYDPFKIEM